MFGTGNVFGQKKPAFQWGAQASPFGGVSRVFGLMDERGGTLISMQAMHVTCRLLNTVAETKLTQRYQNTSKNPVEVIYTLPVDASAAISGFEARLGDRPVRGIVVESADKYDDALSSGHVASLATRSPLDRSCFDLLTVRLGNLAPNAKATITVTCVMFFEMEARVGGGGAMTFNLPHSFFNTAIYQQLKAESAVSADIFMPSPIKSLYSPNHALLIELDHENPLHCTVKIGQEELQLASNRDLVLKVDHPDAHEPFACLSFPPAASAETALGAAVMVTFVPLFDAEAIGVPAEQPFSGELIFVVDQSGSMASQFEKSMAGFLRFNEQRHDESRMSICKDALQVFLRSLPEGCKFNVVSFGSTFSKLFPASVDYNEESLTNASTHVQSLRAVMGGTNLLDPLADLLNAECADPSIPRQIFVLTDGEIPNPGSVMRHLRKHAKTTRVFMLGIGEEVNKQLMKRIAAAANGQACFITTVEEVAEGVIGFLSEALQPVLQEPSIDWGTLQVKHQSPPPGALPPIFSGTHFTAFALLEGSTMVEVGAQVTLSGRLNGVPTTFPLTVNHLPLDGEVSPLVRTLAVQRVIRDLEDSSDMNSMGTAAELSLAYQVLSSKTAFVAVEERNEAVEGTMMTVHIPIGAVNVAEQDTSLSSATAQPHGCFGAGTGLGAGPFGGFASGNTSQGGGLFGGGSGGSLFGGSSSAGFGGSGGSPFGGSLSAGFGGSSGGPFGGSAFGNTSQGSSLFGGGGGGSLFGSSSSAGLGGSGGGPFGGSSSAGFGGSGGGLFGSSSSAGFGGHGTVGSSSSSGSGGLFGAPAGAGGGGFGAGTDGSVFGAMSSSFANPSGSSTSGGHTFSKLVSSASTGHVTAPQAAASTSLSLGAQSRLGGAAGSSGGGTSTAVFGSSGAFGHPPSGGFGSSFGAPAFGSSGRTTGFGNQSHAGDQESFSFGSQMPAGASRSANVSRAGQMHNIVSLQHSNGSWSLSQEFLNCCRMSLSDIEAKLPDMIQQHDNCSSIWATAIAIAFLHKICSSYEKTFRILEQKARRWLRQQLQTSEEALVEIAAALYECP